MIKIDDGARFNNRIETPPPKPPPPPPPPPVEDPVKTASQKQYGDYMRMKMERLDRGLLGAEDTGGAQPTPQTQINPQTNTQPLTFGGTPEENLAPLTPQEREAREAAQQVEQAYNDHPNVIVTSPGGPGRDPNEPSAQEAAAQKLREVTANQSPEVAALTIKYAKPTIDRITIELGRTAQEQDGGYGDSKPDFDNVVNDLAVAANHAATAPNGKAAVEQIASSIVRNIDPEDVGRFDEALGKTIATGAGGELAAEVTQQLKAAGRVGQADDILQNVEDGINELHDRATEVGETVNKYNEELAWLTEQWKPLMTEEQLANAIQAYKNQHPDYVQALKEVDEIAVATIRAIDSFGNARGDFNGLGHADDVDGALTNLLNDKQTMSMIAQSPKATEEIERLMQQAENNPNEPSFFDHVASVAGKVDDGKFLSEIIFNKALDATIDRAFDAAKAKDSGAVDRYMARLEKYADKLGYKDSQFKDVLQQYGRVAKAGTQQETETALRVLARKIDSFNRSNPETFSDNGQMTDKLKRFGLVLGAVGVASAANQAFDEPTALNIAGALNDALGLGTDVGSSLQGSQSQLVKNILQNKSWFNQLPFEAAGKAFGGLGLVLDTIGVAQSIAKGDYVDAGLGVASTVGGAMMLFGGAAVTGVGAVIVGAAIIGKFIYEDIKEANKHETDGARAFLRGAGIDAGVANHLINNDGDGRSPAPVFSALANHLGVDPKEFLTYLSQLSPDETIRLVETAHGVDPDENGVYLIEKRQPAHGAGKGGVHVSRAPNDLTDLTNWMRENGYTDAPGL